MFIPMLDLQYFSEYWFGPASLLRRRLISRIRRNPHIKNLQFRRKLNYLFRNQPRVLSYIQGPFLQTQIQSRIHMAGFTYKYLQKMYPTPTDRHFRTQIQGIEISLNSLYAIYQLFSALPFPIYHSYQRSEFHQ